MGRLTALRPQLRALGPALATHTTAVQRITGSGLQAIRRRILARDYGMCQCPTCKRLARVRPAHIVDHIKPLWAGGTETDGNRQSMNNACHALKSAHEAACRARGIFEPWQG